SSSLPAWPTNGTPCWSSWKPGASPTKSRSASGWPTPKTVCVRVACNGQRAQPATSCSSAASPAARVGASVPAATGAAAASTGRGHPAAGRHGAADRPREDRELLRDASRTAVGAARALVVHPDELLEVALALHADV